MPGDDLLEHAKSGADFYALLGEGIHSGSSDKDISRAYRRTALKHHPDKNKDDPDAVAKFHALQVAYDVLSDPAARLAYDAAREARERKKAQAQRLDGQRRAFADELLRAEREGIKRKYDDMGGGEEDALEREIKRLAEDGRRRRQERADNLRREAQAAEAEEEKIQEKGETVAPHAAVSSIPIISRTIKIQFRREQTGHEFNVDAVKNLFSRFGAIESVHMLSDKRQRPLEGGHKQLMGRAGIVFESVVGAYSAVTEWQRQSSDESKAIDAVTWAEGKEPESMAAMAATPTKPTFQNANKVVQSSATSLQESTFLRLKQAQQRKAERKKYEELLRQQEAVAAEESGNGQAPMIRGIVEPS